MPAGETGESGRLRGTSRHASASPPGAPQQTLHLVGVQAHQGGQRTERQRLQEAVDVLLDGLDLARAVHGGPHVPQGGRLVRGGAGRLHGQQQRIDLVTQRERDGDAGLGHHERVDE
jgi:hypothetical protein